MSKKRSYFLRFVVIVVALGAAVAPMPAGWVEQWYSTGVYLGIQRALTPASNRVSFALFDLLLFGGGFAFCVWWVVKLRAGFKRHQLLRSVAALTAGTVVVASVLYLIFLATWGLNYRRVPLTRKLDFEAGRITPEELLRLTQVAVGELNRLYDERPQLTSAPEVELALSPAFEAVQRDLRLPTAAVTGRPKVSLLNTYFRWTAIDGMTDPFFLEVLINDDVLPIERPAVLAHEWAHLAGFADESEASFVAWLVCLKSSPPAQYSGWLTLFMHLFNAVPADARPKVSADLGPGPRGDLAAIDARLRRSVPVVREGAREAYDRFLKANRVALGVESYDAVVRLAVGTRFTEGWTPGMR